jgi:hypothetical protein
MVEPLVFLEVRLDMALLSKKMALLLFCSFRQAERSVHFAHSSPSQWLEFVAYYHGKQPHIANAIAMLRDAGAVQDSVPRRHMLAESSLLSVARSITGLLCNRLKRSWSFSVDELSFFSATLERLRRILRHPVLPASEELIELRLDCFECHYLIGRKLFGVPEIRKADAIEHFNQSDHIRHVTFQEMDLQSLCDLGNLGNSSRKGSLGKK